MLAGPSVVAWALVRRVAAGALLTAGFVTAAPVTAPAADTATLKATYAITLAIFTIGRVDVEGHFTNDSYTTDIQGSTTGLARLVSDSSAELAGSGTIAGSKIVPSTYRLKTSEAGFDTSVDMAMRGGAIVKVDAEPKLRDVPDRVPLTDADFRRVLDPVGALMVALGHSGPADGKEVCERTVRVFDGWQRYDVALSYKETKKTSGAYAGPVIVCQARYVPVAGHRMSREAVQYMAQNQRLEAWLAPIKNTTLMVPTKIVIGTQVGDLVITARDFEVTNPERQALAD